MLSTSADGFLMVMAGTGGVLALVSARLAPRTAAGDEAARFLFGAVAGLVLLTGTTIFPMGRAPYGLALIQTAAAFAAVACLFCAILAVESRKAHGPRLLVAGLAALGVAAASPLWGGAVPHHAGAVVVLFSTSAAALAIWRLYRPSGFPTAALLSAPFGAIGIGLAADLVHGSSTAASAVSIALAFLIAAVGIAARRAMTGTWDRAETLRADQAARRKRARVMMSIGREVQSAVDGIVGISSVMKSERHAVQSAHYRGFVSNIHQNGRAVRARLVDLLDLAAMDTGGIEIDEDIVDVAELFYAVRDALAAAASARNIRLEIAIEEGAPAFILGDDMRLFRMLTKMGDTALSTMQGGGLIAIRAERSGAEGLALRLIGHGRGLVSRRIPPGAEIDLTLAAEIARAHGGDLGIDITAGQPMIFGVALPPRRNAPDVAIHTLFPKTQIRFGADQPRSAA